MPPKESSFRPPLQPSYRLHKARGCAVVTINGKDHYLGKYGSPESHEKYARLIAKGKLRETTMKNYLVTFALLLGATQLTTAENLPASSSSAAQPHYLDRHKPVAIWTLDQSPESKTLSDTTGQYKSLLIGQTDKTLPRQVAGARDFLGKGWSFQDVKIGLATDNLKRLQTLGDVKNTKGISVSYWLRIPASRARPQHRIMCHESFENCMNHPKFSAMGFGFRQAGGLSMGRNLVGVAFDDKWHHVVGTIDFDPKKKNRQNLVIYLDGKEVERGDADVRKSFNSTDPRGRFVIGAYSNGLLGYDGELDDVALFDYPLTPDQVLGIYTGPVFTGREQTIYLPDAAKLDAITPEGKSLKWSKTAGPGEVIFADAAKAKTTASFSAPGEYQLVLTVEGYAPQPLKITVHPATPPKVYAGDPAQIPSIKAPLTMRPMVTVPGRADGNLAGVSFKWEQVEGPGIASFSNAASQTPTVKFDTKGAYRLQLTATRNGLSESSVVSVLVGTEPAPHYAMMVNPLYLFSLNTPAKRPPAIMVDDAEATFGQLAIHGKDVTPATPLPQIVPGARPFTGAAWDFSNTLAGIQVFNRFNISRLGDLQRTSGLSLSLWFKGDKGSGKPLGPIGGRQQSFSLGHHRTGAIHFNVGDAHTSSQQESQVNLLDNQWHHAALSADFAKKTDNIRVYIDGKLSYTQSHHFTKSFNAPQVWNTHSWASFMGTYGGQLDDIMAFTRPISETEVAYLYNGPDQTQKAQLKRPVPTVDAGQEQVHRLPVKDITLSGTAKGSGELTYKWELAYGPSEATFSDPTSLKTKVSFGPVSREPFNPDYRRYVFRLWAYNGQGPVVPGTWKDVSVVFYDNIAPPTRKLSKRPPVGIYPRLFFNTEDLPAMRQRIATDPLAQAAKKAVAKVYQDSLFKPDSPMGEVYQQLKEGQKNIEFKLMHQRASQRGYEKGRGDFYGHLAGAAFLALLDDDPAKRKEMGTVLARAAEENLKYYQPDYYNQFTHDIMGGLGMAYDFLYNDMTESQRKSVRTLIAKMTKWRQTMGSGFSMDIHNATNWNMFHDWTAIAALAIEGQEGYDPGLVEAAKAKLRSYLSQVGHFKSGYGHEGYTYVRMGMESGAMAALALSRRGENLYQTTNEFAIGQMMFRCTPPGTGYVTGFSDAGAKITSLASLDYIIRYLWADDPAITCMYDRRIKDVLNMKVVTIHDRLHRDSTLGSVLPLMFATGPLQEITQAQAAAKKKLPLDSFCDIAGYINTRSGWGEEAANLVFRSRMDKYALGHRHADVNTFELYSHGVGWIMDQTAKGANDYHQTVLVDGVGTGGSIGGGGWPSLPGRIVDYQSEKDIAIAAGDAKPAYDYVFGATNMKGPIKKAKPEEHGLIWADFMYPKTRADLPTLPTWRSWYITASLGGDHPLIKYNPMQRAFRTVVLNREKRPYALIIDDYQKDDKPHTYQWVANPQFEKISKVSGNKTDLILKHALKPGVRLLVRVLQADGQVGSPKLEGKFLDKHLGKPNNDHLTVTCKNVVAPNFKILLFPYREGEALPETTLKDGELTIQWPDQIDRFSLKMGDDGQTRVEKK